MQHWQPDWPLSFIAVDPPAMASTTPLLALPRPGPSCGRRRLGARLPGTCSPCRPGEPSARGQTRSQASALILQQIWPGLSDLPGQVGQTSALRPSGSRRRRQGGCRCGKTTPPPELLDVDVFMPGPESCSSFVNGAGFTYHQPSLHCSWHPASTWSLAHRNGSVQGRLGSSKQEDGCSTRRAPRCNCPAVRARCCFVSAQGCRRGSFTDGVELLVRCRLGRTSPPR